MSFSSKLVMRGAAWTIGAYGASVGLRFGTNVVLSRLVAPEVFGVMLIINTLRNGIELISDVGIGQNIVHNKVGESRSFRDVAWTIQLLRGFVLFSLLFAAAAPLGKLYSLPSSAIQLSALVLILMGAASVSIYLLQRRLQFIRLNMFDLGVDATAAALVIGLAFVSPTMWSLIIASILTAALRTIATYFLPEARVWLAWQRDHAREILSFGKWIYLSSLLAFLCASFDKLYLGQAIPLALLGIYGLARNVADLPSALFMRLGHLLVFPVVAAQQAAPREQLRHHLAPLRFRLLLASAACIAFGTAFSDYAVRIIYDSRYHDAAWMLPMMLIGVWGAILCSMNEYVLLGLGKPLYGAAGSLTKLVCLVVGMPFALQAAGLPGAIVLVALSDFARYVPMVVGQKRERQSFVLQDATATLFLFLLLAAIILMRWEAGFGTPFDGMVRI